MASNMSTLDFEFAEQAEFADAMTKLANETVEHLTGATGEYAIWRSRTGAELWFHLSLPDEEGAREILGLTPFFEGKSDNLVSLAAPVQRPEDNPLEGAFYAWVKPDSESGEGSYPIVFDAVDFAAHTRRKLPLLTAVRLSGFARELTAHASEEAYTAASKQGDRMQLGPQAFVPMGLFAAAEKGDDEGGEPPSSTAILTGRVLEHRLLTNEATAQPFHWLLVESLDATYDIVADPAVVSGEIKPGCTIECACWLFGRILG